MKITRKELDSIIQEELAGVLGEISGPMGVVHKPAAAGDRWGVQHGPPGEWLGHWSSQIKGSKGNMPFQTGDYGFGEDEYKNPDAEGIYVDNPTFGAHYPDLGPGSGRNYDFSKGSDDPQGLGAYFEKDWSEQVKSQIAGAGEGEGTSGETPGAQKAGAHMIGGKTGPFAGGAKQGLAEQLKQMVREELKNLLESDK